jgi:hypothetical protein
VTNYLLFGALYPEEFKAYVTANKKFYATLFEAVQP